MNLLLYKDGRMVIADAGKPLEGNNTDLSNLFAYVTDPQDGDSIVYDSTARVWKTGSGGVSNLTGLTDVNLSNPTDGQTLVYDAATSKWVNGSGGSGSGFSPDITNPQDGDTLVYDATAGKWVNGAGGGGALVIHENESGELDRTWQEIHDAISAGQICISLYSADNEQQTVAQTLYVTDAVREGSSYYVRVCSVDLAGSLTVWRYETDSADGYPAYSSTPSEP